MIEAAWRGSVTSTLVQLLAGMGPIHPHRASVPGAARGAPAYELIFRAA